MKNILNYLFLFFILCSTSCERSDANPSTVKVLLANKSSFDFELQFFYQEEITSVNIEKEEVILLHGGIGLDDFDAVLHEYPNIYDSLYFIQNNTIQRIYYDKENDPNACLVEKNPLCLEQYEKTVKKGRKGATITEYLLVIE